MRRYYTKFERASDGSLLWPNPHWDWEDEYTSEIAGRDYAVPCWLDAKYLAANRARNGCENYMRLLQSRN